MVNQRGQLILTAAILVSLTIVASAILLNGIHASADVNSYQERQGLSETERSVAQVQENLETLFLANGSQESLPYVTDKSAFKSAIQEYQEQYLNLSIKESSRFMNVSLAGADDTGGNAIWQNETNTFPSGPIVNGAPENLTAMSFSFVEIDTEFTIEIKGSGSFPITVRDNEVEIDGEVVCNGYSVDADNPVEIELAHGEGTISADQQVCTTVSFGSAYHNTNKHVTFDNVGNDKGTFSIVADDGNVQMAQDPSKDRYKKENVLINPIIHLTMQDSQVTYEGNSTLFGGGS
ncbi:hypothetical protein ACFQJ7_15365 [Halovenus rubra]|uniref:Uncharacterized protein n=2 Tax=Halovenus rubra TaxID=869890 RepID=A0ACC7E0Q7_9EURY|nr:hypothetical protein [Halovenus rubra]